MQATIEYYDDERRRRRREQARRIQIIGIVVPGVLAGLLLTYRALVGENGFLFNNSLTPLVIIALIGASAVSVLMFYLQSDSSKTRSIKSDVPATAFSALESELYREQSRNRDNLEVVNREIVSLRKELSAVTTSKEAITEDQTASLVEIVRQKIRKDASSQFLEEIRQSLQSESRARDTLAFSRETADRLIQEVAALSKRGNLNLSLGITITVAGLGVLAYVVFQGLQIAKEPWAMLSHYVPRLSLVLFIELFAYFFLRLYKSSLSEIKYFQNELTNVEAKRLALVVAITGSDSKTLTKVVTDLAATERNFVLEKGQTTVELESSRVERDSNANLLEKIGAIIGKLHPHKE